MGFNDFRILTRQKTEGPLLRFWGLRPFQVRIAMPKVATGKAIKEPSFISVIECIQKSSLQFEKIMDGWIKLMDELVA